jgi:hypothetical protein
MRLLLDTFVRWLITAGLFLGAIAYFRAPETIDLGSRTLNAGMAAVIAAAIVAITALAVEGTDRCIFLLSCCDPDYVKKCLRDLDSPTLWRKRLAVRTLADYLGGNIGIISPFGRFGGCDLIELEAHAGIIKELWAAKQAMVVECPSQPWLLQRLARNMKDSFWRLAQCRIDWMISRFAESFRPSADIPGADVDSVSASSEPLSLPGPLPPLEPERLIEAMEARTTKTLQESAQVLNDAPAGILIVDSEEPVGELLAQLFLEAYQVELLLRMGSTQPNPSEIFSTDRGPLQSFRFFGELVERAGNALKDALTDLNLLAEEVRAQPSSEDLPFMSPDEYVAAMRLHVEEAFKQFVEITNQTPTGRLLVAEEAGLCRIFAKLHAKALETGLELRLQRAENLKTAGQLLEKTASAPHLRKAASPPLPAPFLSWAAKYRCMRVAGTRFPLIRGEMREAVKSDFPDEPPITSVKPGPN